MLVVHVYSRELPVLPEPWEDELSCLDTAGPSRLLGRISLGPLFFPEARCQTVSLPPDCKPHPVTYALSMVLAPPPQGGITRTFNLPLSTALR